MAGITKIESGAIADGAVSNNTLDTVSVAKGGTGLTTLGSAGQVLTVANPGSALEFADAGGGGGVSSTQYFTSPGTYTKPASVKTIRVTVLGGGGNGGNAVSIAPSTTGGQGGGGGFSQETIQAPSVPGPVSVTVGGAGGTSSFGSFLSATGGGA